MLAVFSNSSRINEENDRHVPQNPVVTPTYMGIAPLEPCVGETLRQMSFVLTAKPIIKHAAQLAQITPPKNAPEYVVRAISPIRAKTPQMEKKTMHNRGRQNETFIFILSGSKRNTETWTKGKKI